jgi:hypothetical protein
VSTTTRTRKRPKAAQLGETTFDDWYETPVFDTEPDERIEQLATSKRAPLRLFAGMMLRLSREPGGPSLRQRTGRLLDRWAEREAASQARLEAMILPRRWRS